MKLPPDEARSFFMSTELECLTCVPEEPERLSQALDGLLTCLSSLAPTVWGPGGLFNGYGRVYVDCGHLELAVAECHSPYVLPLLVERQQWLVRQASAHLAEQGTRLLIACNNHSGLLTRSCPVWGAHENHTVPVPPSQWTKTILPFLVTRIFGGAGGIEAPCGNFLAAVRPLCMERATGGSTTHDRSIHSTSREEHHMGPNPSQYRYHLILGDGHRSHFNLALQFGATALAIKAVCYDPQLERDLDRVKELHTGDWVALINRLNVLQKPGEEVQVDPLVIRTQRIYLDAAHRYATSLEEVPGWITETLQDWEDTLAAMERMDRPWLAARLDTFAKYEFYSAVLADEGLSWAALPSRRTFFDELALLDHSYHDFCSEDSVFSLLEKDGLLDHRVGPFVRPGEEPTPFVPEVATRAQARARFIRDHATKENKGRYHMDWSVVLDRRDRRVAALHEPDATEYSDWSEPFNSSLRMLSAP